MIYSFQIGRAKHRMVLTNGGPLKMQGPSNLAHLAIFWQSLSHSQTAGAREHADLQNLLGPYRNTRSRGAAVGAAPWATRDMTCRHGIETAQMHPVWYSLTGMQHFLMITGVCGHHGDVVSLGGNNPSQ